MNADQLREMKWRKERKLEKQIRSLVLKSRFFISKELLCSHVECEGHVSFTAGLFLKFSPFI